MAIIRLRPWVAADGSEGTRLYLWCPACEDLHAVEIKDSTVRWDWDGNEEAPTISPSILVRYHGIQPRHDPRTDSICHSFVRAGRWEFLDDCTHMLAGKTAPVEPIPSNRFGFK